MGININDLNHASSLLENESIVNNIRELSSEELKITGGTFGFGYYPFVYFPTTTTTATTPSTPSRNSDDINININLNNEIDNEADSESNQGLRPAISY